MTKGRILQEGRNCWRICRADKVAFLIDGDNYFGALYHSLPLADKQILILSWDIYSRLHLVPPDDISDKSSPTRLGDLLNHLLTAKEDVKAYILNWDFAFLFTLDRELLPIYKLDIKSHPRLTFRLDNQCPLGASHHQKVVVVDDRLAFAGGLDITRGRWDTSQHRHDNPTRQAVDGTPLPIRPYHDMQMAVSGEAAAALGDLARGRWQRATGQDLPRPATDGPELWPEQLPIDLDNVDVGIARTQPGLEGESGIDEVKQLFLDSISAAHNYIYIENQYFTSPDICEALCQRLAEEDGPEVVLALPLHVDGWLSQQSMDTIRVEMIRRIRAADKYQRLAVYFPAHPELGKQSINLHAKLMIIDDYFLRIGSSNLNNRSQGLDTECDLAIEASTGNEHAAAAIRQLRDRVIAHHHDCEPAAVSAQLAEHHSLIAGINSLRKDGRSFQPLEPHLSEPDPRVLEDIKLSDPEKPVDAESFLEHFVPPTQAKSTRRRLFAWVSLLAALLGLAAAWRFTPLNQWLDMDSLMGLAEQWGASPWAALVTIGVFLVGGLVMIPVTAIIIVAILIFDPVLGFLCALTGSVLSALTGYWLGSQFGGEAVKKLPNNKINQVSKKLAKRGILTIIFVRIVPIAPFTLINVMAGASHIKLRDFFLGSLIGLCPGILGITLLTESIKATLQTPSWTTLTTLILVACCVFAIGYWLSQKLLKIDKESAQPESREKTRD